MIKDRFNGKKAIVTGGARGIGFAAAQRLAQEGASVAIISTKKENSEKAAKKITGASGNIYAYGCDISDYDNVAATIEEAINDLGGIDIVVNSAGITQDSLFLKMTPEKWNKVISVNLTGTFNVIHNVVSTMKEQKYGRIINVSSLNARGSIGQANYAASKSGMMGFTSTLAKELGRYNITANIVSPGFTATDMVESIPDDVINGIIKGIPLNRLSEPEEQASMICYLASDEAAYITGENFIVAGGA